MKRSKEPIFRFDGDGISSSILVDPRKKDPKGKGKAWSFEDEQVGADPRAVGKGRLRYCDKIVKVRYEVSRFALALRIAGP